MSQLTVWRRSSFDQQFDALVRNGFGDAGAGFVPATEIGRDGDDATVRLELPGVRPEDVTVEVEQGRLVVRGERKDPRAEESRGRTEIRYGGFRRGFSLPRNVTSDAVSASYDAGVLTVRVIGAHTTTAPTRIAVTTA
jgi:HSP20 family protein